MFFQYFLTPTLPQCSLQSSFLEFFKIVSWSFYIFSNSYSFPCASHVVVSLDTFLWFHFLELRILNATWSNLMQRRIHPCHLTRRLGRGKFSDWALRGLGFKSDRGPGQADSLPLWKGRKMSTSHLRRNLRFTARIIAKSHAMGTQGGTPVPCSDHRPGSAWLPDKGNSSY